MEVVWKKLEGGGGGGVQVEDEEWRVEGQDEGRSLEGRGWRVKGRGWGVFGLVGMEMLFSV
jgi:hypothetical protein